MTVERISIVLETVSFFLVTLDLFGKERLEKFYNGIRVKLFIVKRDGIFKWAEKSLIIAFMVIAFFFSVLFLLFCYDFLPYFVSYFPHNTPLLVGGAIVIAAIFAFLWTIMHIYIGIISGMLMIVSFVLRILTFLFERYRLEGVMLTIGTVLFLVSKVIAFLFAV